MIKSYHAETKTLVSTYGGHYYAVELRPTVEQRCLLSRVLLSPFIDLIKPSTSDGSRDSQVSADLYFVYLKFSDDALVQGERNHRVFKRLLKGAAKAYGRSVLRFVPTNQKCLSYKLVM